MVIEVTPYMGTFMTESEEERKEKERKLLERNEELENLRKKIWSAIYENYRGEKSDHDTVTYIRERILDYMCGEDTE